MKTLRQFHNFLEGKDLTKKFYYKKNIKTKGGEISNSFTMGFKPKTNSIKLTKISSLANSNGNKLTIQDFLDRIEKILEGKGMENPFDVIFDYEYSFDTEWNVEIL